MIFHKMYYLIILVLGLVLNMGQIAANPAVAPLKGNIGLKSLELQVVNLGEEIKGMEGRELRMRLLTIEPNGQIGIHSHKDRPSVAYVLQGTDTISSEDGSVKVLNSGDSTSANKNTTHWHQNKGKEAVKLLIVDIFHNAK